MTLPALAASPFTVDEAQCSLQVCERYRAIPIVTSLRDTLNLVHPTEPHAIGPRVACNSDGAVVGSRVVGEGSNQTTEAFIWLPRAMYGLSAGVHSLHPEGAEGSVALGINDVGSVAGGVLLDQGSLVALSNASPCVWWRESSASTGHEFFNLVDSLPDHPEGSPIEAPDPRTGLAWALSDGYEPVIVGTFGYCNDPEGGSIAFGLVWSGAMSDQGFILPVDWELPTMGRPYAIDPLGHLAVGYQARPPIVECTILGSFSACPHPSSSIDSFAWTLDPPDATGDLLPFPHLIEGESTPYYFNFARAIAEGDEERIIAAGVGQQANPLAGCARSAFIWSLGADELPCLNLGAFLAETSNASGAESISISGDGLIRVAGFRRPFAEPLDPEQLLDPLAIDPIAVVWEHAGGEDLSVDWCAADLRDAVRGCTYEGDLELAASVNARGIVFVVTGTTLHKLAHLADFNGDDRVNGDDLGALLWAWNTTGEEACPWDLDPELVDGERIINGADLGALLGFWTTGSGLVSIEPLCCDSESMMSSGMTGEERLNAFLIALGFDTDEQFVSWADGKSSSQLETAVEYALMVMNQEDE